MRQRRPSRTTRRSCWGRIRSRRDPEQAMNRLSRATRTPASPVGRRRVGSGGTTGLVALMLGPSLVLIGLFLVGPVGYAIWLSLTNKRLTGFGARTPRFVGLDNYRQLLESADFLHSLGLTGQFVFFSAIVGQFLLGMLAAVLLTRTALRGKGLIGSAILLPMVVPEVV